MTQSHTPRPPLSRVLSRPVAKTLWACLALSALVYITYHSLVPNSGKLSFKHADKFLHFTAYFGLGILFTFSAPRLKGLYICAGLIGCGAAIEIAQHLMGKGRQGSWLDGTANSAGVICGVIFAIWFLKRRITP